MILNYNGAELLPQCLPSIVAAAGRSNYPVNITVLDNLSTDAGLEYVAKHFPCVEVAKASANRILASYNEYLPKMDEDVAVLLNNDIRVDPAFINPLMEKFEKDPECFLVAPKVMDFAGTHVEAGKSKAGIRFGLFWCDARYRGYEEEFDTPSETFSSGFGAFSRKKFLELGGYDERYYPGIMEDVDICYRASQKGWKLYYEPGSVVYHVGQASFKKTFGSRGIAVMAARNNFLFMWKNFRGSKFWIIHLFWLPFRLLFSLLKGRTELFEGFSQALKKARV